MIHDVAKRQPQALALDDGRRRRTWAEFADRVARWARLLRGPLGLAPGENAAILATNRNESIEAVIAAMYAGIWLTPINWHLTPAEISHVVRDSGARVMFTDADHHATARACGCPTVIQLGAELDALLADSSDEPMPTDGPAGGAMIYTSGSTGQPKGVKRRRARDLRRAMEHLAGYASSIHCDGSGPHLVAGPLYHAAPLTFAVMDQLMGAAVLIMPRWDERRALHTLKEREVHHTHMVPTMFVRLLRLPAVERDRFVAPALHTVLHGAAPVSQPVKRRMIEWWGPVFYEYWGSTESGVISLVDTPTWLQRPGTVGRARSCYTVFAADRQGRELGPGERGTLYTRHTGVKDFFSYHDSPAKTAGAFIDSYTHTVGDIGYVDEAGFIYLTGRATHTIISGGVNIYPAEIEAVLDEHPAVLDVAVFGIPDEEWGEQVKAAVQLVPGIVPTDELTADLLAFAGQRLAGYKVPRTIDFEPELPRTPAGKLYVRRLRDRYWRDRERDI